MIEHEKWGSGEFGEVSNVIFELQGGECRIQRLGAVG